MGEAGSSNVTYAVLAPQPSSSQHSVHFQAASQNIPHLPPLPTSDSSPAQPSPNEDESEDSYLSLPERVPLQQLGFGEYDCTDAIKIMMKMGYDNDMVQESKRLFNEGGFLTRHDVELLRRLVAKRRCMRHLKVHNLVFVRFGQEKKLDK
jgi:hypothetical protein